MPICTASAPIRAEEERQGLWRDGIYEQIGEVMPMQGGLRIEGMCHLARVSRSGFYRLCKTKCWWKRRGQTLEFGIFLTRDSYARFLIFSAQHWNNPCRLCHIVSGVKSPMKAISCCIWIVADVTRY